MADTTLAAIQKKVRRLTRSPSPNQISDSEINEYINTFLLYDLPEHLRLFTLRTTFSFYTNPYQDKYPLDTASFVGVTTNPLYDFRNRYVTTEKPAYIGGILSLWSQSREEFYNIYPLVESIQQVGTGDGITTVFTGTVPNVGAQNTVLLQNNVLFDSLDSSSNGLSMVDVPVVDPLTGNPTINGNLYAPNNLPSSPPTVITATNTINYVTGVFTVTFSAAPGANVIVNSQTVPQVVSKPQMLLAFDSAFWVRPIPDQPYKIEIEVLSRPTELLNSSDSPELKEWWQYIAYGAAKKIFEDRSALEDVLQIMPEFKMQERLILRRTLKQRSKERTATLYTQQTDFSGARNWWWGPF